MNKGSNFESTIIVFKHCIESWGYNSEQMVIDLIVEWKRQILN